MKNLILMVALALPTFLFSQKDLDASVISSLDKYVQVTQGGYAQGMKFTTFTTVGSTTKNTVNILDEKGKDYVFQSDAEILNYMDRQGFDFVSIAPVNNGAPGLTIYRQILFRKRG